jgi:ABC-type sugar transport system substrate-binding protein
MTEIFTTCPAATKVVEAEGLWNADKGMAITEDWLQSQPSLNVIAAMNDEMAIGAIQALKAAGADMNKWLVFGVDGTANGQVYIKSGELDATTYMDLAMTTSIIADTAERLVNGEQVEKTVWANDSVVLLTKDNIDQIIK